MNLVVTAPDRLDRFLALQLAGNSRSKLAKWIDAGEVTVNGIVEKPAFRLEPGMIVTLEAPTDAEPHDFTPADIPLQIVFEDEYMLVVNKPRGLASHPARTLKEPSLVNALLARGGPLSEVGEAFRPGIVHRLDKETTGLMVVAKTDAAHRDLARQIESKTADRRYVAVVAGQFAEPRTRIAAPIGRDPRNRQRMAVAVIGKPAITHVATIHRLDGGTLVACRLETGRTHQIRVHLQAAGHPVLGDDTYAPREYAKGPLQLHSTLLRLRHPISKAPLEFFAAPDLAFLGHELVTQSRIAGAFDETPTG